MPTEDEMREAMKWFFAQDEETQRAAIAALRDETLRHSPSNEGAVSN